jgi:hypothetical protein
MRAMALTHTHATHEDRPCCPAALCGGGSLPMMMRSVLTEIYLCHACSRGPGIACALTGAPPPAPHGGQYTNFSYSKLRLDKTAYQPCEEIVATVAVTNDGATPSDEVRLPGLRCAVDFD